MKNHWDEPSFSEQVLYEHQLWFQAMGEHGRFIHETLSPGEIEKIEITSHFIQVFDELLSQSKKNLHEEQIYELTKLAHVYTEEFNQFMQGLIREHLLHGSDRA